MRAGFGLPFRDVGHPSTWFFWGSTKSTPHNDSLSKDISSQIHLTQPVPRGNRPLWKNPLGVTDLLRHFEYGQTIPFSPLDSQVLFLSGTFQK
jgi:hypothetical protein